MTNNEILNAYVGDTQVAKIYLGTDVVWPTTPPEPIYSAMPLTIEALETGTFYVRNANVNYSINGAAWEITTGETALALNTGDTVRFKGTTGGNSLFTGNTLAFKSYGNIESLEYGDDFIGKTSVKTDGGFNLLFASCTGLTSAENLVLPAATLVGGCYSNMFERCTNLTQTPELPATTLARACYKGMFSICRNLIQAPELPATTLANSCYEDMFRNCTSLIQAPELPATTLAYSCYSTMFQYCSNLKHIKCLATDISATKCTNYWLSGVAANGTFVKHPDATWSSGVSGIPSGWTVEDADI